MHASMYKRFHLNISLNLSSPWNSSKKCNQMLHFYFHCFFLVEKKNTLPFITWITCKNRKNDSNSCNKVPKTLYICTKKADFTEYLHKIVREFRIFQFHEFFCKKVWGLIFEYFKLYISTNLVSNFLIIVAFVGMTITITSFTFKGIIFGIWPPFLLDISVLTLIALVTGSIMLTLTL